MEAQVKKTLFFPLCKLCKPPIFNFSVRFVKSCTGSALVLPTNIWKKPTKYVILVSFSLSAKSSFPISAVLNLLLEPGISLFTEKLLFPLHFDACFFQNAPHCSTAIRYLKEKGMSGAPGVHHVLCRTVPQMWATGAETHSHSVYIQWRCFPFNDLNSVLPEYHSYLISLWVGSC